MAEKAASQDHDGEAVGARNNDYSSDEEREGRFYGPDSSWRFYTKEERDLASSLDQIENNDLSAHLYNAHNLKRRLYGGPTPEPWHGKQRWLARDNTGDIPFHPDTSWTAWPLEPVDVPRSSEQWGVPVPDEEVEAETYRKRMRWTPGAHLRECMHAEILRQAKEQFVERDTITVSVPGQGYGVCHSSRPGSDSNSSESSISGNETPDELAESNDDEQAYGRSASNAASSALCPVPMADDELAEEIARPTVNHIMTKLDDLLRGLHHSRQGHRQRRPHSRSVNATPKDRGSSEGESPDGKTASRSRSPPHSRKRQELGARDWSEVLGIAALVGWDTAIIARAAERCAELFDERMEFRVMPATVTETSASDHAHSGSNTGAAAMGVKAEVPEANGNRADFGCPHTFCNRHDVPYSQLWRLREHLKRKHRHDAHAIDMMVGDVKQARAYQETESKATGMVESEHELPGRPIQDEYLQPILINVGRSRDKRARRTPSREHLRKAATAM